MAIINYIPNVKTPTGFDILNTVSQFTNHVATGVFTNMDTYEINVPAPNDILTGQFVVIFVPDTDSIMGMKISINNGVAIPIDGVSVGSLQAGVATSLLVDAVAGVAYSGKKPTGDAGLTGKTTVFNADGSITETRDDGSTLVTVFNGDGSITETLTVGGVPTVRTTTFSGNTITEVIS